MEGREPSWRYFHAILHFNFEKLLVVGTQWVQTALEVTQDENGKRHARKLRAFLVPDRTADTLAVKFD